MNTECSKGIGIIFSIDLQVWVLSSQVSLIFGNWTDPRTITECPPKQNPATVKKRDKLIGTRWTRVHTFGKILIFFNQTINCYSWSCWLVRCWNGWAIFWDNEIGRLFEPFKWAILKPLTTLSLKIEFSNHEKKQECQNQIEYLFVFIRPIISCSSPYQTSFIFGNGKKLLRMLLGAHYPHNRLPL